MIRYVCTAACLSLCFVTPGWAQIYADQPPVRTEPDQDAIVTFSYENDIFSGEDNNYTNGVRASYISPENDAPDALVTAAEAIPFYPKGGHTRWNLAIGQSIYTPNDITLANPPVDDQPYAGWLYGTAGLVTDTGDTLDTFQVTFGMVGPASGAEHVQKTIHKLIDSPEPQGWDTQLRNEPGVVLTYQRKWRNLYQYTPFGGRAAKFGLDLSPSVGANIGNIFTDASAGAVMRIGYDLPSDYGPPLIRPNLSGSDFFMPSSSFGWYVFGGVEGRAVGRNIFLDGNSFDDDTRHVDKRPFIGAAQLGLALTYHNTRVAYTHVFETREFETQQNTNQYGAVTVSVRF
jgi:lipid A 3-O-deacylase